VSELERVGRLPVFVDEEQWSRAFDAARQEVGVMVSSYAVPYLSPQQQTSLATRIASAALRAAAQDDGGDIEEVPGVTVSHVGEIPNQTDKTRPPFTVSENVRAVRIFNQSDGGEGHTTYP
jgi:hypothetical protein